MIKDYLTKQVEKRSTELDALCKRVDELEKINGESKDESELKATAEELDALKSKKEELEKELAEINAQLAEIDKPAPIEEQPQRKAFLKVENTEERGKNMNIEERKIEAETIKNTGKMTVSNEEVRAILVSSGKIATPTGVSGINELDSGISSIVDLVDVVNCEGMGSNKVAYEFTASEAGVTAENVAYHAGESVFDFVTIQPQTITTISYLSKQVTKQSPLDYKGKVEKSAYNALRKKVSEIIVDAIKASTLKTAITLTAIDEKTLRTIALNYGGDEAVNGSAVLLLNKATLVKLGDVRGSNEKVAVYEITPDAENANTGTIKDGGLAVKYCLNAHCADDEFIYGQAKKFELDLFSNYEVKVSEDFKFDTGMLAVRGDVELGGDITFKDGFIVASL